jgi:serine/threonine protein kinase
VTEQVKDCERDAHAIAYLRTAFSRPVIHMGVKLANIFLDHDDVPKLTNFMFSVSIPEDETHVVLDDLCGTIGGFSCPRFMRR